MRLVVIGDRTETRNTSGSNRIALKERAGVSLFGNGLKRLNVLGGIRTNDVRVGDSATTVLEEELVSGSGELTKVVQDGFVLGGRADLFEGGTSHGGEQADDDHDNHDFDEGEALAGTEVFHNSFTY